jgi:Tol biopolymer transport system component
MQRLLLLFSAALVAASAAATGPQAAATRGQIAVATTSGRIVLVDSTGRRLATLSKAAGRAVSDWAPAWSPDGRWLAFVRSTNGRRSFHVFVMRADGSGVRQLTRGRFDESPAWSPDGQWIAYTSAGGIRIVHPNGKGSRPVRGTGVTVAHYSEPYATLPSWTPRGRLTFSFHPEVSSDWPASCRRADARCGWVFASDLDGRHRTPVLRGRDAHWSLDGRTIVFTPPNGGVTILANGKRHSLGRGYKANWSPDATKIVYARLGRTAAGDAIWIMDANGRNPHRIMDGASDPAWRPPIAP